MKEDIKIALCMIVKGSDEEALLLTRCLETIAPFVDGIFITRTHLAGEQGNNKVWVAARKFGAFVSDFEWVYDFSAARNYNFSQVTKDYDYIIWSDADDMWRGVEDLRPTLLKHPSIDGFGVEYLYDWDEFKQPLVVHRKTMIVKNDGGTMWVGAIHEDLEAQRQLDIYYLKGIERLHLSNKARFEVASRRNLEIAGREVKEKPDDPRSYWNLANSCFGVADFQGAIDAYDKFLHTSESDDEKYLAYCRVAEIYRAVGDSDSAEKHLYVAIGLKPFFPEAYFQMAHLFFERHNWEKAEEYCLQGMVKRPQVARMIVYNPRDYDYNPMMLLAQVYYYMNRPDLMLPLVQQCLKIYPKDEKLKGFVKEAKRAKAELGKALVVVNKLRRIRNKEKLRAAIDALPLAIRSHPSVVVLNNQNFVRSESSGKDIAFYCFETKHIWYDGGSGFIGGSEEAVINLARELAALGWNVEVYNNCGHMRRIVGGVTYIPFWEWNYRDRKDVVIIWRSAKALDAEINSPCVLVDVHDVIPKGEFTEKRLHKVHKIMVKSEFHRSLFPNVPDHKIAVVPNGIDLSLFHGTKKKDKFLLINTSSADRSLDVLPKLFREVKKRVPQARLKWAYGWETYKVQHAGDANKLAWMHETIAAMKDAGIEELGRLSQADIATLYEEASILAYPTEFAEIDCISVRKAQAAGCFPITTDFAALQESVIWGDKIHSEKNKDTWARPYQFHFGLEDEAAQREWVEMVCVRLLNGIDATHPTMSQFNWVATAAKWDAIITV